MTESNTMNPSCCFVYRMYEFEDDELEKMFTNVNNGQRLAEGDTYTRPVLANTLGNEFHAIVY